MRGKIEHFDGEPDIVRLLGEGWVVVGPVALFVQPMGKLEGGSDTRRVRIEAFAHGNEADGLTVHLAERGVEFRFDEALNAGGTTDSPEFYGD